MKFTVTDKKDTEIEINTPSFYTHYGSFYKLSDTYLITVSKDLIFRSEIKSSSVAQEHLKKISDGEYGEISQGMFISQFDAAIELLQKLRT